MLVLRIAIVALAASCWVITAAASSSSKLIGTITINSELSAYEEAPADADQYPASFRREKSRLYVPSELIQATIEWTKSVTLPAGQRRRDSLNALDADRVRRFLLRSAVMVDKIRSKYRDSAERSSDLDAVFEPEKPFTQRMATEEPRIQAFMKTLYPGIDASPDQKALAMRVASRATTLWPAPSEYGQESDTYKQVFRNFRYLAQYHLDPVFDLKLRNGTSKPISITRVSFDAETSEYLKDYGFEGVNIPGATTIVLEKGQSGNAPVNLTIAPGREVTLRIALRSVGEYHFFGTIAVQGPSGLLYRSPVFSIAFLT